MIAAIIIAGGKARRFQGAEKAMILFNGKALVEHVITSISKQVDLIAINQSSKLKDYDLPVVADLSDDQCGPIGGLEAAIEWAMAMEPVPEYLLTVPVDTPFLPLNLVAKLLLAAQQNGAAIASTPTHIQATISLHKLGHISAKDIDAYKHKALRDFWTHVGATQVCFDDESAFININCPEDIKLYEK
jgi:molybdenum cofactor guanylyltransferase